MTLENARFVSSRFLWWALMPIFRHVDVEEGEVPELEFPGMDSNNAEEVKARVIRSFIVPWLRQYDETTQRITKDSFRYYLNHEVTDAASGLPLFQRLLGSTTPSFEEPKPARLFFVWMWEEVYGPEDYHIESTSDFIVDNERECSIVLSDEAKALYTT